MSDQSQANTDHNAPNDYILNSFEENKEQPNLHNIPQKQELDGKEDLLPQTAEAVPNRFSSEMKKYLQDKIIRDIQNFVDPQDEEATDTGFDNDNGADGPASATDEFE